MTYFVVRMNQYSICDVRRFDLRYIFHASILRDEATRCGSIKNCKSRHVEFWITFRLDVNLQNNSVAKKFDLISNCHLFRSFINRLPTRRRFGSRGSDDGSASAAYSSDVGIHLIDSQPILMHCKSIPKWFGARERRRVRLLRVLSGQTSSGRARPGTADRAIGAKDCACASARVVDAFFDNIPSYHEHHSPCTSAHRLGRAVSLVYAARNRIGARGRNT